MAWLSDSGQGQKVPSPVWWEQEIVMASSTWRAFQGGTMDVLCVFMALQRNGLVSL